MSRPQTFLAIAAAILSFATGCCTTGKPADGGPERVKTGNSGTLNILPSSFSNGNNGVACFPTTNGWDRYFTTFYFLGPNAVPPDPNKYPNDGKYHIVTLSTDVTTNGPNLVAGVVIINNLILTNRVCSPTTNGAPRLGTASMVMGNTNKYRATIFYKSATLGNLTNIVMTWNYHD